MKTKPNPIGTYSKSQTKPFYIGTKVAPSGFLIIAHVMLKLAIIKDRCHDASLSLYAEPHHEKTNSNDEADQRR